MFIWQTEAPITCQYDMEEDLVTVDDGTFHYQFPLDWIDAVRPANMFEYLVKLYGSVHTERDIVNIVTLFYAEVARQKEIRRAQN